MLSPCGSAVPDSRQTGSSWARVFGLGPCANGCMLKPARQSLSCKGPAPVCRAQCACMCVASVCSATALLVESFLTEAGRAACLSPAKLLLFFLTERTCAAVACVRSAPAALQAESCFSEAGRVAAASAAYAKHESALARRVAQLPRPVMSARSDSSISITIDKRGRVSDDTMAVGVLCVC